MATGITELIADVREQVLYLQELGIDTLNVEVSDKAVKSETLKVGSLPEPAYSRRLCAAEIPVQEADRPPAGSRLASLPKLSVPLVPHLPPVPGGTDETLFEMAPALPEPTETIPEIRAEIGPACMRCPLHSMGRSQVVNSVGNFNADLMFCGEAPGADEDRLGEPFVGRAGQLLTDIIEKGLKMRRQDVFIGNINRCRPPGNRAPFPDEAAVCKPFLLREIAVVRPKVIVVLGATAAQNLLETKTPISKLRGHFHDYLGVKVMPTFHPAYLLRDPHKKREVWEDMKMVRDHLQAVATK
jgi:uracil-DNA glycosylase family 4